MSIAQDRPAVRGAAAARMLTGLAFVTLAIAMPVSMVLANKSAPLVLGIAAVLTLAGALLAGRGLLEPLATVMTTPVAKVALAGLAWICVSVVWSHDRAAWLRALLEMAAPLAAAVICAALLPRPAPRWLAAALAAGVLVAAGMVWIELDFGLPIRRLVGARAVVFGLNRPLVLLVLLVWPLIALARARNRESWGMLALVPVGLAAVNSESGTAVLAFATGLAAYAVARLVPRVALGLAAMALTTALALAPFTGDLAARLMPQQAHEALRFSHSAERVAIWQSFGEVARLRPVTGTGFGSSVHVDADPVAGEVPPSRRVMLAAGHPHNAFLQIWSELGLPGAVIAGCLMLLVLWRLALLPRGAMAAPLALMGAVASVALVSHGAWQAWWIASVATACLLMGAGLDETRREGGEEATHGA